MVENPDAHGDRLLALNQEMAALNRQLAKAKELPEDEWAQLARDGIINIRRGSRREGDRMTDGQMPTISLMDTGNLRIQIPMTFKMKHGRTLILMPQALDGENPDAHTPAQEALITALARAFAWTEMLERGEVTSISDLARRLEVDSSYIGRILRLTTLAPDIVEAIIRGQEPNGLSLAKLIKTLPEEWAEQRQVLVF